MDLAAITRSLREQLAAGADVLSTVRDDSGTAITLCVHQVSHTEWRLRVTGADDRCLFEDRVDPEALVLNLEHVIGYALRLAKGTAVRAEATP